MADFKLSRIRFTWKGPWVTGTTYTKDDIVQYGAKSFVCLVTNTASANFYTDLYQTSNGLSNPYWTLWFDGYTWKGAWQPNTTYNVGDYVQYGSIIYICNTTHTSASLAAAALSLNLTSITGDGTTATLTYATRGYSPFEVGTSITVAGIGTAGFNGTFVVSSSSTTAVTYSNSTVSAPGGSFTSGVDFDSNNSHGLGQVIYGTDNSSLYYGLVISNPSAALTTVLTTQPIGTQFTASVTYTDKVTGVAKSGTFTFTKRAATQSYTITGGTGYLIPTDLISSPGTNYQTLADTTGEIYATLATYTTIIIAPITAASGTVTGSSQQGLEANQSNWSYYAVTDDWVQDWAINTRYRVNDMVRYGGTIYRCALAHDSSASLTLGLEADQSKWTTVNYSSDWKNNWSTSTRYKLGDVVRYGAIVYKCVTPHTSTSSSTYALSTVLNSTATTLVLGSGRIPNSATWTISNGTININAIGLPYHSYSSPSSPTQPYGQNYNVTFSLRAGTNVAAGISNSVAVGAPIGYWLNGVAIYASNAGTIGPNNTVNGFYPQWTYNASSQSEASLGYSFGADNAGGQTTSSGVYHYRDFNFATAWTTGNGAAPGSVTPTGVADAGQIPYLDTILQHEKTGHSKILGWALDGYPIYGPYGYGTANNAGTAVRRMQTGYTLNTSRPGGPSSSTYPLGTFVQDYSFTNIGDLDTNNGRYCVTPEYPNGTYAYFVTVDSTGKPVYPYVIGNTYYGDPTTVGVNAVNGNGVAPSASTVSPLGLENDLAKWTTVHQGIEFRTAWAPLVRYRQNDLVKYGADLYLCSTYHTSTNSFDLTKWTIYVPSLEYANTWSTAISYVAGDVVTYGGYQYTSLSTNNLNNIPSADSTDWKLLQQNYNIRGDYSSIISYKVGDVVRRDGYLYVAIADNTNIETTDTATWTTIVSGTQFRGPWASGQTYLLGDIITFYGSAYTCLLKHPSSALTSPIITPSSSAISITSITTGGGSVNISFATQSATPFPVGVTIVISGVTPTSFNGQYTVTNGSPSNASFTSTNTDTYVSGGSIQNATFWGVYVQGDQFETLQYQGDLQSFNNGKNAAVSIGTNGNLLKVNAASSLPIANWGNFGQIGQVYYVATTGTDAAGFGLTLNAPWKTVAYACANITGPATIFVKTGTYSEALPISIPAGVAVVGDELRGTTIQPATTIIQTATGSWAQKTGLVTGVVEPGQVYVTDSLGGVISGLAVGQPFVVTGNGLSSANLPSGTYYIQGVFTGYVALAKTVSGAKIVNMVTTTAPGSGGVSGVSFSAGNNSIIVPSTTGLTNNMPLKFTSASIVVSATATGANGNTVTITSTAGIAVGNQITFSGTSFGGLLTDGTIYYVSSIVSGITITLATSYANAVASTPISIVMSDTTGTMTANINTFAGLYSDRLYYVIGSSITPTTFSVGLVKNATGANVVSLLTTTGQTQAIYGGDVLNDMFYMRNATGLRNCTLRGLNGSLGPQNQYLTKRPLAGAYVSLDPGSGPTDTTVQITTKSPYVQNVTTFGFACVGCKIDGTLHNAGNRSIVSNDFTQVISDGIGVWCTGPSALTELVSVFSYYGHVGYLAENGGRIRATNGNTSYGSYGCVAEGYDLTEVPLTANVDNRNQQAQIASAFIGESTNKIIALEYSNAGQNYTSGVYQFTGSGLNAAAYGDEIRDQGIFEARIIGPDVSAGGAGYINQINNAQTGDTTSITIAQSDQNKLANYQFMRVILTSGTGVGQYGQIVNYNSTTKYATVAKESFTPLLVTSTNVVTGVQTSNNYIIGNVLTIGLVNNGTISPGLVLSGTGITAGTYIKSTLSGTTYTINNFYSPAATTAAFTGIIATSGTVGSPSGTGPWAVSISVTNTTGVAVGSVISATTGTGSFGGGAGSVVVTAVSPNSSISITQTGGTIPVTGSVTNITVSGMAVGSTNLVVASATGILANQIISGTGIPAGTTVSSGYTTGTTIPLSAALTSVTSGAYSFYTPIGTLTYSLNTLAASSTLSLYAGMPVQLQAISQTATTTATTHTSAILGSSSINSSGILTVGTVSGTIVPGMVITGGSIAAGTYITANITGSGAGSQWQTSTTTIQSSTTITATQDTVTLSFTGGMWVGQQISFSGSTIYGGLTANSPYYILNIIGNNITLSTLPAPAGAVTVTSSTNAVMTAITSGVFGGVSPYTTYYVIGTSLTSTQFSLGTTPTATTPVSLAAFSSGLGGSMNLIQLGWDHVLSGTTTQAVLDSTTIYSIEPRIQFTAPSSSIATGGLSTPSVGYLAAAYGSGKYVVFDQTNSAYYSSTGSTWSPVTGLSNIAYSSVTYGSVSVGFLAVASNSYTASISTDGQNWSSVSLPSSISNWSSVTYNPALSSYLAIGFNSSTAASSLDASTWTTLTMPATANWTGIQSGNNGYIVAISSGATYSAISGTNGVSSGVLVSNGGTVGTVTGTGPWTAQITALSSTTAFKVGSPVIATASGGNLYGGSPTSVVVTSIDSASQITYTVTGGSSPVPGSVLNVKAGGSQATFNVIAAGSNYTVTLANGGFNYTPGDTITIPGTALGGTSTTNDLTITVVGLSIGAISNILTSGIAPSPISASSVSNGNTWSSGSMPATAAWNSIAYGNSRFVAVGTSTTVTTTSAYSFDGITWNTGYMPAAAAWSQVKYGQGQFVAVASSLNYAAVSRDGLAWTVVILNGSTNSALTFGNNSSTPAWVLAGTTSSTLLTTGATAVGRAVVSNAKISQVKIYEPGGNYSLSPTVVTFQGQITANILSVTAVNSGSISLQNLLATGQTIYGANGLVAAGTTITALNSATFNGTINNFVLIPTSITGTISTGMVITGTNIAASTIVTVTTTTTVVNITNGKTISYVSGSTITPGAKVSGSGVPLDTYVVSGVGPWVLSNTCTNASNVTLTCTLYSVSVSQTLATTTAMIGTSYTVSIYQTISLNNFQAAALGSAVLNIIDPNSTTGQYNVCRIATGVLGNPSFTNRGTGYRTSTTVVSVVGGGGFADVYQPTKYLSVSNLASLPTPGAALSISNNSTTFRIVVITNLSANKALFQISPALTILTAPVNGANLTIRQKYSQCRITGHDFLLIGTGNQATTNYPNTDVTTALSYRQITESGGGRVFQTSTDQDGNFLVGNLFGVQQASGIVTISADQFSLAGLQQLTIGALGLGPNAVIIQQFSTDSYFTANSDTIVPTQKAIKTYVARNVSGGGSTATTNTVSAGQISIGGPNIIVNKAGGSIIVNRTVNVSGKYAGLNGILLAHSFFESGFGGGASGADDYEQP